MKPNLIYFSCQSALHTFVYQWKLMQYYSYFLVSSLFHTFPFRKTFLGFKTGDEPFSQPHIFSWHHRVSGLSFQSISEHILLYTKLSNSLIWNAGDATAFLVLTSDQRILGRLKYFKKLTFLETEIFCLYFGWKSLAPIYTAVLSFIPPPQ